MENEFLKNENKALKDKIDTLYTVITDFENSEKVIRKKLTIIKGQFLIGTAKNLKIFRIGHERHH